MEPKDDQEFEAESFENAAFSRREMLRRSLRVGGGLLAIPAVGGLPALVDVAHAGSTSSGAIPGAPNIPSETVRLGIGPYIDHAYWSIGAKLGWFNEVGIKISPGPAGKSSQPEHWGPVLISKSVDIQSASESHYIGSMKTARNLRQLVWSDLFQGFAILVQPHGGFKSAEQFRAQGLSPSAAIKRAVQQLRGKTFLYPSESGVQGFVNTALTKAGMTLNDVKGQVVDDPQQVPIMLTHRADAQVSGVPTRLTLQGKGFKVLVSAADLAKGAKPSASSPELLSIFRDGAATTAEWFEANQDTALRFVSVVFRITNYIVSNPVAAAKIEGPFVNSISGTSLKTADVLIAYKSLDPFYSFEQQRSWYENRHDPLYYRYEIGAQIKLWEQKGLFKRGAISVNDIALNADIYHQLARYKTQSERIMRELTPKLRGKGNTPPGRMLAAARRYHAHFNYLDALRFAKAAAAKA